MKIGRLNEKYIGTFFRSALLGRELPPDFYNAWVILAKLRAFSLAADGN